MSAGDVFAHPMQLPDAAFWRRDDEAFGEWCAFMLRAGRAGEAFLDGPERVALDAHGTLDLHYVRVDSLAALALRDPLRDAVLVGIQTDTHALRVAPAFPLRRTAPPEDAADEPMEDGEEVFSAEHLALDARAQLALRWVPAPWDFVLLLGPTRTNRTHTDVVPSVVLPPDLDAARFIAEARAAPRPDPVFPPEMPITPEGESQAHAGERLPDYRARENAPAVPREPGIVLALDAAEVPVHRNAALVVRGAFQLPLLERFRVAPQDPAERSARPHPGTTGARPEAVIPLDLVILGDDVVGPVHIPLRVPVYTVRPPASEGAAPVALGRFALDLYAIERMPRFPQRWSLHAFSGAHAAPTLRFTTTERAGTTP